MAARLLASSAGRWCLIGPGGALVVLARFLSWAPVIAPMTRAPITRTVRRGRRVVEADL